MHIAHPSPVRERNSCAGLLVDIEEFLRAHRGVFDVGILLDAPFLCDDEAIAGYLDMYLTPTAPTANRCVFSGLTAERSSADMDATNPAQARIAKAGLWRDGSVCLGMGEMGRVNAWMFRDSGALRLHPQSATAYLDAVLQSTAKVATHTHYQVIFGSAGAAVFLF